MNAPALETAFPLTLPPHPASANPGPDSAGTAMFVKAMKNVTELNKKLVASTFLVPMLNFAQRDPLGSDLLHGGFAEDVFRSRLNTRLADSMSKGMGFSVTHDLSNRIGQWLGRQQPERVQEISAMKVDLIG